MRFSFSDHLTALGRGESPFLDWPGAYLAVNHRKTQGAVKHQASSFPLCNDYQFLDRHCVDMESKVVSPVYTMGKGYFLKGAGRVRT